MRISCGESASGGRQKMKRFNLIGFMSTGVLVAASVVASGASGEDAGSWMEPYMGRETIFIDGKPEAPLIYSLVGGLAGEPWRPEAQKYLHDFADQGYRLLGCETSLGEIWHADGLDVDHVRRQIRAIQQVRPDAKVLLRLVVAAPGWWVEKHPEELIGWTLRAGTQIPEEIRQDPKKWKTPSYASQIWRRESGEQIRRLLQELAASPEGDALFALLVIGGEWHEWFYPKFEFEPDNGPAMTRHFREWLRGKYVTDDALQAAWNDTEVTFETAAVPGVAERFKTAERMFRDPQKERHAIDYYKCHQELVADVPIEFCRAAKEAWPRPIVVGTFHAYFLHLTHQASGGHLEAQRVIESPYIDFLSSPFSYEFDSRFLGGSGHYRCLWQSLRQHGKLWLSENDHPTHVGDNFRRPGPFAPTTVDGDIAAMRRNTAHCFTLGQGMWWFDFGANAHGVTGGWWEHPALMEEAGRLLKLTESLLDKPYSNPADVLFVYDTECFYYMAAHYLSLYNQDSHWDRTETLSLEALNETVAGAYKSGVAFDLVHLNDLDNMDLSPYKTVVFGFTPYLSEAHRATIREKVVTPARTVVWVYAPGYVDGERLSTERVAETVGINIEKSTVNLPPQLLLREGSITPDFPETRVNARVQDAWTAPTFQVVDPEAEVLGYYGGSVEVALARKEVNGATVWYSALPLKHPPLMREIFRQSGAHIYNEKNDVISAGGGVLWIHTETGGSRTLALRNGTHVELALDPWSTVILDGESGEILLK
jgi:hypothetical protein